MDISNVGIGLAFLAGLASFVSPCVFSLVPAYIGYLGGRSASTSQVTTKAQDRLLTFSHGLAFVLGFSVVFILLGAATSALSMVLYDLRTWIARIGGIVIVVFGLHMAHIIRIPFLEYDLRPQSQPQRSQGYLSSVLMGVFFSAGWSPCVGPVLGSILTLSLTGSSPYLGVTLLSSYSAGLAIPFLIAAVGIGWVTTILRKYGKVMHYIEIVMGVLLIVIGVLLFLGIYEQLASLPVWIDFGI